MRSLADVVAHYRVELDAADDAGHPGKFDHVRGMLSAVLAHEAGGDREKAMRWIGFIQGALWVLGVYTIDQMRDHNRDDGRPLVPSRVGAARASEVSARTVRVVPASESPRDVRVAGMVERMNATVALRLDERLPILNDDLADG